MGFTTLSSYHSPVNCGWVFVQHMEEESGFRMSQIMLSKIEIQAEGDDSSSNICTKSYKEEMLLIWLRHSIYVCMDRLRYDYEYIVFLFLHLVGKESSVIGFYHNHN